MGGAIVALSTYHLFDFVIMLHKQWKLGGNGARRRGRVKGQSEEEEEELDQAQLQLELLHAIAICIGQCVHTHRVCQRRRRRELGLRFICDCESQLSI